MKIGRDSIVTLSFTLFDAQGEIVEQADEPISYLHGGYDNIFPLVEQALQGKSQGESASVKLEPQDAFGDYDEELVRVEPRNLFPKNVSVGMQFEGASEGSDHATLYTVTDISDASIVVDGNHPLAGKAVRFICTITAVRAAIAEELRHGHVHGEGGHHH